MRARICLIALLSGALAVACQSQTPAPQPPQPTSGAVPGAEPPSPSRAPTAVPETPSSGAPIAPTPGAPSDLAGKVIPATVDWFGAIDLRALQGTVLERQFRPWVRYLNAQPSYQRAVQETGAGDLLGHTLVFGGTFSPETPMGFDLVAAAFGLKDEAKGSAWAAERLAESGPPGGELKTGHKAGIAAWLGGPTLAGKAAALLDGKGESVNDDPAWVEVQRAIDTKAPLWGLVRIPEMARTRFPSLLRENPGLQYFPGAMELLGMTHAAISLHVGNRLELRIALRLQSAEDAQVVAEQLQLGAEATLWEPTFFFDIFHIGAAGPMVLLRAATSEKTWRIAVFWSSIAAQAVAYEHLRPRSWE